MNGVGAEVPLDEETVKAFIADNPQLFRKLEGAKRFKERVARDVTRFSEELGWVDKQLEKWPRIFLPHPAVVFGVLSAEGSRNRFFTAAEISDEIVRGLSGHVKGRKYAAPRPEVLARSLSALGGIGVVDKLGPADDGEYRYQLARMTDGQTAILGEHPFRYILCFCEQLKIIFSHNLTAFFIFSIISTYKNVFFNSLEFPYLSSYFRA